MSDEKRAILDVRLRNPTALHEVEHWAAIAEALGFPANSPIILHSIGESHITVSAYFAQVTKVIEL